MFAWSFSSHSQRIREEQMNKYMKMSCKCEGCRKAKELLTIDVATKFAEIAIEGKSKVPLAELMQKIERNSHA